MTDPRPTVLDPARVDAWRLGRQQLPGHDAGHAHLPWPKVEQQAAVVATIDGAEAEVAEGIAYPPGGGR